MASSRRIVVFQHIPVEHPGVFREFLDGDDVEWHAVELDQGEPVPAMKGYDALWVMGGPMDVWQEDQYPWLVMEKIAIREALEQGMPFLGLCLGHQLLAEALGGEVGPSKEPEIGILDIHLTPHGEASPFFNSIPTTTRCLQWHSAEVKRLPPGAVVLASTPACKVQAMSVNDNALSLQFHVELTSDTVAEWGAVPEYKQALEKNFGVDALDRFSAEAALNMSVFNQCARTLYENWKDTVWGSTPQG